MPKLHGLIYNQDSTDFFFFNPIGDGVDGGAVLDEYLDLIAQAGVKTFMCNTNARKTNYRSDVWESFWDGYEPEGPDDQPFLKAVPAEGLKSYRSLIHSMWALDRQGVDYVARTISRCRLRGVSPWVSLRMNDVHFNDNMQHPFHADFWRDSKRWRGGSMGYYQRGLDYGQPDVREMYRKLIVETLERYDIDGLELDFMREPYLFCEGQEQAGGEIVTQFLREVRRLVDEATAKRGHPIALGVRVPSRVEVAQGWGLDAVAWAQEGLVDLVVVTPRWGTLEYDMPLAEWKRLLEPTGVTLAGGLEILCRPMPTSPAHHVTPAQAAGAATAVLSGGADAVYLFNYFPSIIGGEGWSRETYIQTLKAMNSLPTVSGLPREHVVTWRDIVGPNEQYVPPLPASGTALAFELPFGPAPVRAAKVKLEVTLEDDVAKPPTVLVNATAATYAGRQGEGPVVMEYQVPEAALTTTERASIEIQSAVAVTVLGVNLSITP